MDERERMHQLDGDGGCVEALGIDAQGLAGRVDQQRTQALAAAEHRVAHGGMQPLRRPARSGQGPLEGVLGTREV